LDDYWLGVRLQKLDIPKLSVIPDWADRVGNAPLLSEAVEFYLELKGHGRSKTFFRGAHRTKEYVIKVLGDRPISAYSSSDAGKFRDWLLDKGLTVVSTKRVFATIKSIINLTISEHGLNCSNNFSRTFMPDRDDVKQRKPIPIDQIKKVQQRCYDLDDEPRWLLALISDTGLRLSEAVGLAVSDIKLDTPTPHIIVQPQPWRSLKTKSSRRKVPLVGASLWAAKKVIHNSNTPFAFPRYNDGDLANANSASAALNKWLKPLVSEGCVVHSFRHSIRDRLRAVECPKEIIDQIGGWSSSDVGESYGEGFPLDNMSDWINKLLLIS
jgi:integrase